MRGSLGAATTCASVALALVSYFSPSALAQKQPVSARERAQIEQLRARPEGGRMPPADSFTVGPRAIPAAASQSGAVAVADGSLDVYGHLDGSAYALNGDIVVHGGGVVTGDAVSIGGRVLLDGGRVDGERLTLSAPVTDVLRTTTVAPLSTWQSVKLVVGWFSVLVIIGLGVLVFAESNMDGVVEALEANFTKAFWFGVLGQIMVLPVLTLLCIGLVLTLLGILLVPFAIVAYCIAFAGLLAMGFLTVARLTGNIWSRSDATSASAARVANIRALFIGLVLYMGLWLVAALFAWQPIAGAILRAIALSVSWVAVTLGLGATLLSRAGTRKLDARQRAMAAARRPAPADLAWQTPTPVTGVAAARRPVVATKDAT